MIVTGAAAGYKPEGGCIPVVLAPFTGLLWWRNDVASRLIGVASFRGGEVE